MSFLLHVHADYTVVCDHARHWVRKRGLILHI